MGLRDGFARWVCARARNHRFYCVHEGTKPRFLTKKAHQKSGIPCSGLRDGFARWVCAMGLRDGFARWVRAMRLRSRDAFGWVLFVFVKSLQDDVFTKPHAWDYSDALAFGWMNFVFVKGLQPVPEIPDSLLIAEHGIPDFISFTQARNPVFGPKMGIKNLGFRALIDSLCVQPTFTARMSIFTSGISGAMRCF